MNSSTHSRILISNEALQNLGLNPTHVEPWEDGMRTDGSKGTYEWWYFDSHLDDGSKLVIVFYTKHVINVNKDLLPIITVQYDAPNGEHFEEILSFKASDFFASREKCDIQLRNNRFSGDLKKYSIQIAGETIHAEISLSSRVKAWRPGTGIINFGDNDEFYFAWLPSIPEGLVEGTISVGGQSKKISGTGYHDHNWGNISMIKLMNHWYWGRARIGDYTVITSFITAEKKYGYKTFPIFMIAKDGEILADNALENLTFKANNVFIDKETKKPVHNDLLYDYQDGNIQYKISYLRKEDIFKAKLADTLPKLQSRLAKLVGFDGAYIRFAGTANLEKIVDGRVVEKISEPAIWELMYLGHTQK